MKLIAATGSHYLYRRLYTMEERLRLSAFLTGDISLAHIESHFGNDKDFKWSVALPKTIRRSSAEVFHDDRNLLEPYSNIKDSIDEDDKIMFSKIIENSLPCVDIDMNGLSKFQIFSSTVPFSSYSKTELSQMKHQALANHDHHEIKPEDSDDELSILNWVCPNCRNLPPLFRTENFEVEVVDNFDYVINHKKMCQNGLLNLKYISNMFKEVMNIFPLFRPSVLTNFYFISIVKILAGHNNLVDIFTKYLYIELTGSSDEGGLKNYDMILNDIYPPPLLDEVNYKMAISALAIFAHRCMNGSTDILTNEKFILLLQSISPGFVVPDKEVFEFCMRALK